MSDIHIPAALPVTPMVRATQCGAKHTQPQFRNTPVTQNAQLLKYVTLIASSDWTSLDRSRPPRRGLGGLGPKINDKVSANEH